MISPVPAVRLCDEHLDRLLRMSSLGGVRLKNGVHFVNYVLRMPQLTRGMGSIPTMNAVGSSAEHSRKRRGRNCL